MSDDHNAHRPLPYKVRLRMIATDDSTPETFTRYVTAYSAYEAAFSAMVEVNGASALHESKFTIESIEPDLDGYLRMLGEMAKEIRERTR